MTKVLSLMATALLCAAVACTSSTPTAPTEPPPPPPPPVAAPTLACPSAITTATFDTSAAISYDTPSAEGGSAPVSVTCTPPSGSMFPVGAGEVSCTATDALNRSASCVIPVTVTHTPTLAKTHFVAFGDSITVGIVSAENPSAPPPYILTPVPNDAYPTVLQRLLSARYTGQSITVANAGKGGERAQDATGRAQAVFNGQRPEVALIMMGYNDLGAGEAGIAPGIAALNEIVKEARFRGAMVFLATLTPPPVGVSRGISNSTIAEFNERIKSMARGENAVLVDVYQAFSHDPNRYNSADGRHPNAAGYQLIAETFFASIRAALETP